MSPRRRGTAKRGWPRNLYERDGYYSWRHPKSREEFGLGRDKLAAFDQAIEANRHLAKTLVEPRLVERLQAARATAHTLAAWNEKFQAILKTHGRAANTLRTAKSLGARMVRMLGAEKPVDSVTALEVSSAIDAVLAEGKGRLAQSLRSHMRDSFREARVAGWRTAENPVLDTRLKTKVAVKRARFTWESFQRVYAHIRLTWLRNVVDLALVTAQRRDDLANAMFRDFRDGDWWLIQGKGQGAVRLRIPMTLRLAVFGKSLQEVHDQCRRSGVISKYLVHQTAERGNSPAGAQIWVDTISRRFSDAVTASGVDWGGKEPPTFHELRSLAKRLYDAQGGVNTKDLLGHRTEEMAVRYGDARGAEWLEVATSLVRK